MSKVETNVVKPTLSFISNEITYELLSKETETSLDGSISDIENFMANNTGKDKSDEEKDALYAAARELWRLYPNNLGAAKYNFFLNRKQYKFITNLVLNKIELDVNTVFFAIELTDLMGTMYHSKYTNEKEIIAYAVNATEMTYIYHLIKGHKVKGLGEDAYTFADILRKIGDVSKIFNYYDNTGKTLSTDIQNWVAAGEPGVTLDATIAEEVTEKENA